MTRERLHHVVPAWIGIIIGIVVVVGGVFAIRYSKKATYDSKGWLWGGIVAIVVGALLAAGLLFWLYGTEGGARAQKTFSSETGGGLTRVVKVYDMQGDLIQTYEGKFDVDASEERIIFDIPQEDGSSKRVQIWSSTGTVTIEEK